MPRSFAQTMGFSDRAVPQSDYDRFRGLPSFGTRMLGQLASSALPAFNPFFGALFTDFFNRPLNLKVRGLNPVESMKMRLAPGSPTARFGPYGGTSGIGTGAVRSTDTFGGAWKGGFGSNNPQMGSRR